jgi:plasmid stabilization system protein ParE
MRVVIAEAARQDLIEIGEFIRPHNPGRAASFVAELLQHCEALGDRPRTYPLVPRYEQHGVRRSVHRGYLVFYRINGEILEVLHVLNGARDYESLLFNGPTGES